MRANKQAKYGQKSAVDGTSTSQGDARHANHAVLFDDWEGTGPELVAKGMDPESAGDLYQEVIQQTEPHATVHWAKEEDNRFVVLEYTTIGTSFKPNDDSPEHRRTDLREPEQTDSMDSDMALYSPRMIAYNSRRDGEQKPTASRTEEPHRDYSHDAVIWNFFHSKNRESYRDGSNVYHDGENLYSYGSHFVLATHARNAWLLNGDTYSRTTSGHQTTARYRCPKPRAIISFSALQEAGFSGGWRSGMDTDAIHDIEVIEVAKDTSIEDVWFDKENMEIHRDHEHFLGATLFRYKRRYFLSAISQDDGRRSRNYFLVELPQPCFSLNQAYFALSGLSEGQYKAYLRGEVQRQGEYYFVPVGDSFDLRDELDTPKAIKELTEKWEPIDKQTVFTDDDGTARGTNLHVATEMVCHRHRVYVRGTVRHHEHKMVSLGNTWHRVHRNDARGSWTVSDRMVSVD